MHICRRVRENLHDYAMGQLNTDLVPEVQAHLDECEECCRLYQIEKQYCECLPDITSALENIPAEKSLADSVSAQIESEKATPPVYIPRRRFPFATCAAAAVIILVLVFAHRAGMTENYIQKSDNTANMTSDITNDTANYEYTDEVHIYDDGINQASTEESVDEDVSEKTLLDTAQGTESEPDTKFYMMASSVHPPVQMAPDSAITEPESAEELTTLPDENDPAFIAHKNIAQYNTFISSNALVPLYPQVILHGGDSDFYYKNFVKNNSGGTLIENENFFCLHMSTESLINALNAFSITDYTVIQPENPLSDDMVYLWYK